jgi:uncharacterized membrane protein
MGWVPRGDDARRRVSAGARVAWKAFMPQAGIALALAATIAEEYPSFGDVLATVVIGTVVLNEAIGPFFLWSALTAVGETAPSKELLG